MFQAIKKAHNLAPILYPTSSQLERAGAEFVSCPTSSQLGACRCRVCLGDSFRKTTYFFVGTLFAVDGAREFVLADQDVLARRCSFFVDKHATRTFCVPGVTRAVTPCACFGGTHSKPPFLSSCARFAEAAPETLGTARSQSRSSSEDIVQARSVETTGILGRYTYVCMYALSQTLSCVFSCVYRCVPAPHGGWHQRPRKSSTPSSTSP